MRGPGRRVRARVVALKHQEAEQHRVAESQTDTQDEPIDLTNSTDTADKGPLGRNANGGEAPNPDGVKPAAGSVEPLPLELTDSNLQRIDESVSEAHVAGQTQP